LVNTVRRPQLPRRVKWLLVVILLACVLVPVVTIPAQPASGDYVVLLHGLGRSGWSMKRLEWALRRDGYRVINISYPSTRIPIDEVVTNLLPHVIEQRVTHREARVHFVTHSLGGIIARRYLCEHPRINPGRLVMIGPPNQGSEIVDHVRDWRLFKWLTGPAGEGLGTGSNSAPRQIGIPTCEIGVLAGDRSFNPLFSAWLPGPDDGKVSVESTRLKGMKGFLVLHCSHTWMTWRRDVVHAVSNFLARGQF
jgi:pimeloyl-ACP methyl ester carboxylesterase